MAANNRTSVERAGDREKSLETALLQIERQFGKGSVMRLGDETRVPVEVIPTGSIALDVALGLGGLPRGRIVEVYGPRWCPRRRSRARWGTVTSGSRPGSCPRPCARSPAR